MVVVFHCSATGDATHTPTRGASIFEVTGAHSLPEKPRASLRSIWFWATILTNPETSSDWAVVGSRTVAVAATEPAPLAPGFLVLQELLGDFTHTKSPSLRRSVTRCRCLGACVESIHTGASLHRNGCLDNRLCIKINAILAALSDVVRTR